MDLQKVARGALIFLVFTLSVAVNIDDNVLARLGFEQNYLLIALAGVVFTGLLMHRHALLVILVLFFSLAANMPADFLLNFGLDRDLILGFLVAIVIIPIVGRYLD